MIELYRDVKKPRNIWIQSHYDPRLINAIKRISGRKYDAATKRWWIPEDGIKRFILLINNDPVLKAYWNQITAPTLDREFRAAQFELDSNYQIKNNDFTAPSWLRHYNDYEEKWYEPWPYQYPAALWLASQTRALFALRPGLGKTPISIYAFNIYRRTVNPTAKMIVMCQAGLKWVVWNKQIKKFSDFKQVVIDGNPKKREPLYYEDADIYVINPELMMNDPKGFEELVRKCDILNVDEATMFKAGVRKSVRTAALKKYLDDMKYVWFLTGTPLMNNIKEFYILSSLLNSCMMDPWWDFKKNFMVLGFDGFPTGAVKPDRLPELNEQAEAFMYRKTREDVSDQLPDVVPQTIGVKLSPKQKKIYNQLRNETYRDVADQGINLDTLPKLTRLKQVCMSLELLGETEDYNPKLIELTRLLKEELQDAKVIIFTQYKQMAYKLEAALKFCNPILLTGDVSTKKRSTMEDDFNLKPEHRVFITTTAGGVGLNLRAASVVLLYDYLWNPAMMYQIAMRAVRGDSEHDSVLVISLVAENSIEEKIVLMNKTKQAVSDAVVDGDMDGVKFLKGLGKNAVLDLLENFFPDTDSPGSEAPTTFEQEFDDEEANLDEEEKEE